MKNVFFAPLLLALALNLVACGKHDDATNVGIAQSPLGVPPSNIPPTTGGGWGSYSDFPSYCNSFGGVYYSTQDACQFSVTKNINYYGIGNAAVNSGASVYPYSHIYVNSSRDLNLYVNGYNIGKGKTLTYSGGYSGSLSYSADGLFDTYSVYTVQVTARLTSTGQYIAF